jgi:trigger factor
MKTNIENISSVKKKVNVEVEAEEIDRRIDEAYKKLSKKAQIKGFRTGKVPRNILEKFYKDQVMEDVTNNVIRETLPAAIDETRQFPLTMPAIENEELKAGQAFKYSAVMETRPEFELKDYLGIEVQKENCIITDEDVQKQIEQIRESRGALNEPGEDRGVKDGDYVVIDYEAFEGDHAIEGVKAADFPLKIGNKQFYQGVEEALIGVKKGEPADLKIEFEQNYFHTKLAGKTINFKIEVKDIKEISLPEVNDEFLKGLGGDFNNLDEFRQKVKEDMLSGEEKRIDGELKARLLRKISGTVDFELPESLVEYEINASIENIKQRLLRAGAGLEKSGFDEAKVREDIRPGAEGSVKQMFIIGEIANQKGITVEETDLAEGFRKMAEDFGTNYEIIRQYYEANDLLDNYRQGLLREKTLNYLVENASIIAVDKDQIIDKLK